MGFKGSFGHIGKVVSLLEPGEKKRLGLVALGAIGMALIEVVGVGSIMPFMAVAAKPEIIHTNPYLRWGYDSLGFTSDRSFLIALGVAMLAFLVITNASQAVVQYIKVKFTSMRRHTLSLKLLKSYLGQGYPFFLNRNSYDFIKNINTEITQMISGTLMQFVEFISRLIQITLLTAFLFIVNPLSTLGITASILVLYGGIYTFVRKTLKNLGSERFDLNTERSKIVSEAFWAIKEVKILGIEPVFISEYSPPSKRLARNESVNEIIGDVPKFALETVAFSAIIFFVLLTIIKSGGFEDAAAAVSLYAYAGYRLIPAVQNMFKALTKLRYGATTADRLYEEFVSTANGLSNLKTMTTERIGFQDSITLDNISFTYPGIERPVIENLSLTIQANSLVGFAGKTGSGKTTLVDILLGLLRPQKGSIIADGTSVDDLSIRSWQANLGYVPQNIYLSNDSVAANIAFGVPRNAIDMAAVERAAEMAQIHDFIVTELKDGYRTEIGERGIRLSGGQRQRIGIARALYRNPPVLIMDEATSALDHETEEAVMDAIDALAGQKTILLIAHRLSTLKKCDVIYQLEKGKIVMKGKYEELF